MIFKDYQFIQLWIAFKVLCNPMLYKLKLKKIEINHFRQYSQEKKK